MFGGATFQEHRNSMTFEATRASAMCDFNLLAKVLSDGISGEDSNDEPDDKPDSSTLEEGTMVVGINADLSAELEQIAVGEPVKLIGTRAGDWGEPILFQVEKVIAVVKKHKLRWGKPAKAERKP